MHKLVCSLIPALFGYICLAASPVLVDPQREDVNLQEEQSKGPQMYEDQNLQREQTRDIQFKEDQNLEREQTNDRQFYEDQNFRQEYELNRI